MCVFGMITGYSPIIDLNHDIDIDFMKSYFAKGIMQGITS